MSDAYRCDACREFADADRPAMEVRINPVARAVNGTAHFPGQASFEWPVAETEVELCPECADDVSTAVVDVMLDD